MEENLITENELYNSFHTQAHCCNLWLGHGRILALGLLFFFFLMPWNRFRLLYGKQQPPTCFFFLFFSPFFSFFHLCSVAAVLHPPPHTHKPQTHTYKRLFLSGIISRLLLYFFIKQPRGTFNV